MKVIRATALVLLAGAALWVSRATAAETENQTAQNLEPQAQQAIENFKQRDPGLEKFFASSTAYVVFPEITQGGLIIGAAHGKGLLYQNGKPVGVLTMSQGSIGAQAGGHTYAELIFFQSPQAVQQLKQGNYQFNASAKAMAATSGASQSANYQDGVAIFTLPKGGVMGQAAVGGQKFSYQPLQ